MSGRLTEQLQQCSTSFPSLYLPRPTVWSMPSPALPHASGGVQRRGCLSRGSSVGIYPCSAARAVLIRREGRGKGAEVNEGKRVWRKEIKRV